MKFHEIQGTCDIWDTDYNSDNWEPEFMTIFVTRQSRVTVDSIRNSSDVFSLKAHLLLSTILQIIFNILMIIITILMIIATTIIIINMQLL